MPHSTVQGTVYSKKVLHSGIIVVLVRAAVTKHHQGPKEDAIGIGTTRYHA